LTNRRREEEGLGGAEKPYIDSKKGLGEPNNPKHMHGRSGLQEQLAEK